MSFFTSVEFYIIMTVIAAAIVIASARPRSRKEVHEYLLSSDLSGATDTYSIEYVKLGEEKVPQIEFRCNPNGTVTLVRRGLEGISITGAVSLAVKSDGVDVRFEERLTPGHHGDPEAVEATFYIDFLPEGWYNVMYNSDSSGLFVAFKLHVRPGLVAVRELNR